MLKSGTPSSSCNSPSLKSSNFQMRLLFVLNLSAKKSQFLCPGNGKTDVLDSKGTSAPAPKPWHFPAFFCERSAGKHALPVGGSEALARSVQRHPQCTRIVCFEVRRGAAGSRRNDPISNEATQGCE